MGTFSKTLWFKCTDQTASRHLTYFLQLIVSRRTEGSELSTLVGTQFGEWHPPLQLGNWDEKTKVGHAVRTESLTNPNRSESPKYSHVRYWLLTWEYFGLSDLFGSLQIWSDLFGSLQIWSNLLPVTSVTLSGCRPWYNSQWSFYLPVGPWSRCVAVHALTSSFIKSLNTQHWHSANC